MSCIQSPQLYYLEIEFHPWCTYFGWEGGRNLNPFELFYSLKAFHVMIEIAPWEQSELHRRFHLWGFLILNSSTLSITSFKEMFNRAVAPYVTDLHILFRYWHDRLYWEAWLILYLSWQTYTRHIYTRKHQSHIDWATPLYVPSYTMSM